MSTRRILSVVGARPQFVKLAAIDAALRQQGADHIIVHTGQHYDENMSSSFFADLNIAEPNVNLAVGSGGHGWQTGVMLQRLEPVLEEYRPDWVLVYGDTNSTLAAALAAVKMHIRVAHLEAGLRSWNRSMPEEHNRVLTDHAADLLLVPTEVGMQNLAREGLAERSVLVGDVMTDICLRTRDNNLANPPSLNDVEASKPFVLATIHRPSNTDDRQQLAQIISELHALPVSVVLPAHPRLIAMAAKHGIALDAPNTAVVPPLGYPSLVYAVQHAVGVVTDSGGLQKEAFLLSTPCTTIRPETEWVETLIDSWNVLDPKAQSLATLATRPAPRQPQAQPYGDGRAAERVADELLRGQ